MVAHSSVPFAQIQWLCLLGLITRPCFSSHLAWYWITGCSIFRVLAITAVGMQLSNILSITCRSILIRSCERPPFVIFLSSELSGHSSIKSLSALNWSDSIGAVSIRISLGCVYSMSKAGRILFKDSIGPPSFRSPSVCPGFGWLAPPFLSHGFVRPAGIFRKASTLPMP